MRTMLNALGDRRAALQNEDEQKGFTLIELLVVVIIIGILAAIAIPVYLGIQNGAKDSAVKSDLSNAKIAVVAYLTEKGALPDGATVGQKFDVAQTELGRYGYTLSTGNTTSIAYKAAPAAGATTFCIDGVSVTGAKFHVTEAKAVSENACP